MKFIIKRRTWLRGTPLKEEHCSSLLHPNTGRMCCLGHIGRQLGYKPRELRDLAFPDQVEKPEHYRKAGFTKRTKRFGDTNTVISDEMARVNDDETITDAEREAKLKKLARKRGHTLVFQ